MGGLFALLSGIQIGLRLRGIGIPLHQGLGPEIQVNFDHIDLHAINAAALVAAREYLDRETGTGGSNGGAGGSDGSGTTPDTSVPDPVVGGVGSGGGGASPATERGGLNSLNQSLAGLETETVDTVASVFLPGYDIGVCT